MTRDELLKHYTTNTRIAEEFSKLGERITTQAVQQWPLHGPIPPARELQLQRHRPELFRKRRA